MAESLVACNGCTFLNPSNLKRCEQCNGWLPASSSVPAKSKTQRTNKRKRNKKDKKEENKRNKERKNRNKNKGERYDVAIIVFHYFLTNHYLLFLITM